ncbi:MAG: purine-nucleoside phosphorylase [Crocinitomicaceae bacterium]|jgi:purine-nucleoside phosphorylase|nr:purine-nucleoside phosphorylase [Crocinitomicaceae bacterium]MDG1658990.1 purine-nucleoside phosphorylase [Crocinitomicaceae bacterium]MDG2440488.1 purine-nucleoside phosphorylase [Crocinitomicaceae bacterium]
MLEKFKESRDYIKTRTDVQPTIGIILGTGLGGLVNEINIIDEIAYEDIPNFPVSTVQSHSGKLIFGELGGKHVIAMQGRFHFYEGYTLKECTFPVRVMKLLGIEKLFVSNASGGVNPDFEIGELMIQDDHIDLFPSHPLIGKNIDELGPRFPDMSQPYSHDMIALAKEIAAENKIRVATGTYAGLTGPTLETPAEYSYVRAIGADAVGMSTVPEVIVARHMSIPCFAISIITDLGVPGKIEEVSVEDVIAVANKAEPKMTLIMKELIARV